MNATFIEGVTLEVDDLAAAERFYTAAFGSEPRVRLRPSEAPTSGFRGCDAGGGRDAAISSGVTATASS